MGCLLERKAQIIFVTASSIKEDGKNKKVVVESRPTFAIVRLEGSRERFPIAWEAIYAIAKQQHAENLRRESHAKKNHKHSRKERINPDSKPLKGGVLD
jgi:hypothetical protein